jgi:hypothetical protein
MHLFMCACSPGAFYNYWFSTTPQTRQIDMLFPTPGLGQEWGRWRTHLFKTFTRFHRIFCSGSLAHLRLVGRFAMAWHRPLGGSRSTSERELTILDGVLTLENTGHFLCRWDPTAHNKSCFWNGRLAKTQQLVNGHDAKDTFFRIGSTHLGEYWEGMVDDLAIFDTALSDAAVPQAMLGDFSSSNSSGGGSGTRGLCVRASKIPQPKDYPVGPPQLCVTAAATATATVTVVFSVAFFFFFFNMSCCLNSCPANFSWALDNCM